MLLFGDHSWHFWGWKDLVLIVCFWLSTAVGTGTWGERGGEERGGEGEGGGRGRGGEERRGRESGERGGEGGRRRGKGREGKTLY